MFSLFGKIKKLLIEAEEGTHVPMSFENKTPEDLHKIAADPSMHPEDLHNLFNSMQKLDYYHSDPSFDGPKYSESVQKSLANNPSLKPETLAKISSYHSTKENPIWALHLLEDPKLLHLGDDALHYISDKVPLNNVPKAVGTALLSHPNNKIRRNYLERQWLPDDMIDYVSKTETDPHVLSGFMDGNKRLTPEHVDNMVNNLTNSSNSKKHVVFRDLVSPEFSHLLTPESLDKVLEHGDDRVLEEFSENPLALNHLEKIFNHPKVTHEEIIHLLKNPELDSNHYKKIFSNVYNLADTAIRNKGQGRASQISYMLQTLMSSKFATNSNIELLRSLQNKLMNNY